MSARLVVTCDNCGAQGEAPLELKLNEDGRAGGFLVPLTGWAYRLVSRPPWIICGCSPECRLALELQMGGEDENDSKR